MNKYFLNIALIILSFSPDKIYSQKIDTNVHVIRAWKYDLYNGSLQEDTFDSTVFVMDRYNPLYQKSNMNLYLGNLGSAALSQVFNDRPDAPFVFGQGYGPYLFDASTYNIYRTKAPFTLAKFIMGGVTETSEERILDLVHTQNINEYLNAGFKVRSINAGGFYDHQKNVVSNMSLFSSYIKGRLNAHVAFNRNVFKNEENGGVVDSLFENVDEEILQYRFSPNVNMNSEFRNFNFQIASELKLINFYKEIDTIRDKDSKTAFIIGQLTDFNNYSRKLTTENPLDSTQYGMGVIDPFITNDSAYYRSFKNRAYIKFKVGNQFVTAGLENEFTKHINKIIPDTLFLNADNQTGRVVIYDENTIVTDKIRKNFNTALFGDVEFNVSDLIKLKFIGKYNILGYQLATLKLAGKASINLKNNIISASSILHTWKQDRFYYGYIGNYYQWDHNDLSNSRKWDTEFIIKNKTHNTGIKVNYNLLDNWMYFDDNALPKQNTGVTSVLSTKLFGEFDIWRVIKTKNEVAYQEANQHIIPLPRITLYHSASVNFKLANEVMHVNIGYDLFYFTKYYSNAYMPITGTFHNQDVKQIGNYPFLDVFGGFKVKKVLFFLKYEHVTEWFLDRSYYTALHYPNPGRVLRTGLTWIFLN